MFSCAKNPPNMVSRNFSLCYPLLFVHFDPKLLQQLFRKFSRRAVTPATANWMPTSRRAVGKDRRKRARRGKKKKRKRSKR